MVDENHRSEVGWVVCRGVPGRVVGIVGIFGSTGIVELDIDNFFSFLVKDLNTIHGISKLSM